MYSRALLQDLGIAYTLDTCPELTEAEREDVQGIVARYGDGALTYNQAAELFQEKFHTVTPIDKLRAILEVPEEPLPRHSEESSECLPRRKTQQWTPDEDTRLLAGARRYGLENWNAVAHFVGNGRSRSQCSQRWQRGLDPRISRDRWTPEDEAKLRRLVEQYGERSWIRVSAAMGNRSDVQCRYRYHQLQKEVPESPVEAEPPAAEVKEEEAPAESKFETIGLDLGAYSMSEIFWLMHL
jgi:hypothetical protein